MVHLHRVTVQKRGNVLLNDVSFSLNTGEHAAVIGPNGAGKSTLIKVLTKEFHPLQQNGMFVELFGSRRWDVSELRKKLGIVTPDLQRMCHTPYSAQEIVLSGFFSSIGLFHRQHQISDEMIAACEKTLSFLGISDLASTPMHHLSTGEARRVLIARSLVRDPDVMVLDEPTDNLDIPARQALIKTLRSLAEQGKTLIIITHDLADVIPEIQRVLFIRNGSIFADGKKKELFTEKTLSELYGTQVFLDYREGFYKAWG